MTCASTLWAKDIVNVNGKKITVEYYDNFVAMFKAAPYDKAKPQERKLVLKNLVRRQLLIEQALKQKIDQSNDFKEQFSKNQSRFPGKEALLKDSLLVNLLFKALFKQMTQQPRFSDASLKSSYDKEGNASTKDYYIRHIMTKDEATAKKALQKLQKGDKFEKVANNMSVDFSARQGGIIGWTGPESLPKALADAAAKGKGLYKTPVKSAFGWHIIEITDTHKVDKPSFEQAKNRYRQKKLDKYLEKYIDELESNAKITYVK